MKIIIRDKQEMIDLARSIAKKATARDVFALKGSLGAGKSFFAREFVNAISASSVNVLSPTFNLVYSYKTNIAEIFHFDLYRLKNANELENIGFFDAIKNGICLIEWPEIAENFLPKNYIGIEILNKSSEEKGGDDLEEKNEESEERIVIIKNYPHKLSS